MQLVATRVPSSTGKTIPLAEHRRIITAPTLTQASDRSACVCAGSCGEPIPVRWSPSLFALLGEAFCPDRSSQLSSVFVSERSAATKRERQALRQESSRGSAPMHSLLTSSLHTGSCKSASSPAASARPSHSCIWMLRCGWVCALSVMLCGASLGARGEWREKPRADPRLSLSASLCLRSTLAAERWVLGAKSPYQRARA